MNPGRRSKTNWNTDSTFLLTVLLLTSPVSQSSSSYLGGWHFPGFLSWLSDPPWGPCAPVESRHGVYAPAETDAPYCCIPSHRCSITVNIWVLLIDLNVDRWINADRKKKFRSWPYWSEGNTTRSDESPRARRHWYRLHRMNARGDSALNELVVRSNVHSVSSGTSENVLYANIYMGELKTLTCFQE